LSADKHGAQDGRLAKITLLQQLCAAQRDQRLYTGFLQTTQGDIIMDWLLITAGLITAIGLLEFLQHNA